MTTIKISNKGVTRKDFGIDEDDFVFCSFNQPYKITPDEFNSWMRILDLFQIVFYGLWIILICLKQT